MSTQVFSRLSDEELTIPAGATKTYTATVDDNGAAIALASVSTLVLTLWDRATNKIVNSRDAQDVKNANNVTYHATSGLLTWSIQAGDTNLVGGSQQQETHRAKFVLTTTGGKVWHHYVDLICVPEFRP